MSALDPVQLAALEFARDKRGVGWFMEMGLGKTLTALTEFSFYVHADKVDRMVVICPNSYKGGWLDEVKKHGFRFDVHVFQSSKKVEAERFLNQKHHALPPVLVINYEAIRMPGVLKAVREWARAGRTYLAVDESISIKGYKSAQTRAVLALAAWSPTADEPVVCQYIRLLTGKPQSQGVTDLWGQLRAIGLLKGCNFFAFRGTFAVMGGWEMKQVVGVKNTEALGAIMTPRTFQAKKRDWLPELPRKDFTLRDYAMSTEQLRQYNQMEHQFLLYLENNVVTVDVAIAKYSKLAQILCGFIYDENGYTHELVRPSENPRLTLMQQLLEDEVQGKSVVVYRHRAVLEILVKALAEYDCAWIKGQMTPDEVSEQKERFNNDPHCRIMLAQCDAAKFGHTLLGNDESGRCHTMLFYEQSYSLDTRSQVEDRIHRRGQTENCLYVDFCGSDLDRRVIKALQRKTSLYEAVFNRVPEAMPA